MYDTCFVICALCVHNSKLDLDLYSDSDFGFKFWRKRFINPLNKSMLRNTHMDNLNTKKNPISFELRAKARQLIIGIYSVFSFFIVNQEDALCRFHLETVCAFAFHCSVIFMWWFILLAFAPINLMSLILNRSGIPTSVFCVCESLLLFIHSFIHLFVRLASQPYIQSLIFLHDFFCDS